jgi:hypothetical protein
MLLTIYLGSRSADLDRDSVIEAGSYAGISGEQRQTSRSRRRSDIRT